jgi:hypothetical protein
MLWRSLLQAAGQGREADLDIAMEQTMFFLMHSCGLSREAQNEQSHIVVATTNHPSAPETSQLPPTSTYAPAASHLASSPTSPPNSGSQKIQQLFFALHSALEVAKEQPPYGLTVRPRRSKRTAKSTNLQATSGLGATDAQSNKAPPCGQPSTRLLSKHPSRQQNSVAKVLPLTTANLPLTTKCS